MRSNIGIGKRPGKSYGHIELARGAASGRAVLAAALAAVILLAAGPAARADTYEWQEAAGGPFGTADHWNPAGPPGTDDTATFNLPATYEVTFDDNYTNSRFSVDAGDVTFQLQTLTYTLTQDWDDVSLTGSAAVAELPGATATLTLLGGNVAAKELDIAWGGNTNGTLIVGAGARWTAFQHHVVTGRSGIGTLTIQDGGVVEHGHGWCAMEGGSTGTITVTGLGSEYHVTGWYGLGTGGQGELKVLDQGKARIDKCDMGVIQGGDGRATVDGTASLWELTNASETSLIIGQRSTSTVTARNEGKIENFGSLHLGEEATGDGQLNVESGGWVAVGRQLVIGVAGSGRVDVTGADSQLTVSGDEAGDGVGLRIGDGGWGRLQVLDGGYASVTNAAIVGVWGASAAPSELVVDGTDSLFEGPTFLQVGADAQGSATASNGGILRAGAVNSVCSIGVRAPGAVTATSGGTFEYGWQVFVGDQNQGRLDVTDGGHYSAHSTVVGTGPGSDGTLTVSGPASTMTHLAFLGVGWTGEGKAYFEDGCTVDLGGSLIVGGASGGAGGKVYIRDGATVTAATQARIGDYCPGELYITGGGVLDSHKGASATGSSGIVGRDTAVNGFVSISDTGSQWTQDGALTVGWLGNGYMEVTNHGLVSSVDGIVGRIAGCDGYVLVDGTGSKWEATGSMAIGGTPTEVGGNGFVDVTGGGLVHVGDTLTVWGRDPADPNYTCGFLYLNGGQVEVGPGGLHVRGGNLSGDGTITGDVHVHDGLVEPGASPGLLGVTGTFTQEAGGSMVIEIGDPVFDQIAVTGAADLAGGIDLMLYGTFVPQPGDTFDIVTAAGGLTDSGLALDPGDVGTWQLNWGPTTLQAEYIPEPATLALVALGGLALLRRRGR